MEGSINMAHVAEALTLINAPGSQPDQIHKANAFISQCEEEPNFPLLLL